MKATLGTSLVKKTNQPPVHHLAIGNILKLNYPELELLMIEDYTMPLVTCIMPTANRPEFIAHAIKYFLEQDYPFKELVIIDDGEHPVADLVPNLYSIRYFYSDKVSTVGEKRNKACEKAAGSIIVHWDDDDWYAADWITRQVDTLITTEADICGLNDIQFYCMLNNKSWVAKKRGSKKPWLSGATLAYRKSFWNLYPFKSLQIGEDEVFVRNSNAKIYAHDYYQGFIAVIHNKNTRIKEFEDPKNTIQN